MVLGVASQQQKSLANQEIVLQFTDIEVTSEDAQNTLAILKSQLLDLGVDNINIIEDDSGKLKITYYSDVNVALVKETLSKEKRVTFNYVSKEQKDRKKPSSDSEVIIYDIIISEIQNNYDTNLDGDGYVLETKSENDRFQEPILFSSGIIHDGKDDSIEKVSFKLWEHIFSLRENLAYIFPEVRAGPQGLETS